MYGGNGGVLNNTARAEIKEQMLLCVHFMQENLTERFPETDLHVYKLLRVVDPRLRKRPKLGKLTHGECAKGLLHIFEVPLHGFVNEKKVLASHSAFMCSPGVDDILAQCFVLDKNGNHNEENIYEFYYELAGLGGDTHGRCSLNSLCSFSS